MIVLWRNVRSNQFHLKCRLSLPAQKEMTTADAVDLKTHSTVTQNGKAHALDVNEEPVSESQKTHPPSNTDLPSNTEPPAKPPRSPDLWDAAEGISPGKTERYLRREEQIWYEKLSLNWKTSPSKAPLIITECRVSAAAAIQGIRDKQECCSRFFYAFIDFLLLFWEKEIFALNLFFFLRTWLSRIKELKFLQQTCRFHGYFLTDGFKGHRSRVLKLSKPVLICTFDLNENC